jgi:hypothetical protein
MISWNHNAKKCVGPDRKTGEDAGNETSPERFESNVQIEITPFRSYAQINGYKKYLAANKELRIVEEFWSEDEGYNIVVTLRAPLDLGLFLETLPEVAQVQDFRRAGEKSRKHALKKIVVTMNTPEEILEPA